jgi:5-deoxy-glucuronate isomerase
MRWFYSNGSLNEQEWEVSLDGRVHGWKRTGLKVATIDEHQERDLTDISVERIFIPLSGRFKVAFESMSESGTQELKGRPSVFSGPTDTLYTPAGTKARISGKGQIAIAEAKATARKDVTYTPAEAVKIELRGAGNSCRQVNNFGIPGVLDADRIIACEVLTPSGNWSSYPPHKHDEYESGRQSNLEEIYYFKVSSPEPDLISRQGDPIGYFRNYGNGIKEIDTLAEVRSGDVALVPHGWHGPAMAAPGYDLYYLNVMAGPDPVREWNIIDDPNHAWVRDSWQSQALDPRLPLKVRGES